MSAELKNLADEFNRYFTSANDVDVGERVTVSRDEWRTLYAALARTQQPEQAAQHEQAPKASLREAAQNALVTLDGIADANPRDKSDFETPNEWIAWAKSRARWAADKLRNPLARELYAERILKQMLDEPQPEQVVQEDVRRDAERYNKLVACGAYAASVFKGTSCPWGLAGGRGSSKAELDAVLDAMAAPTKQGDAQ